jgi:glycine cleavage system aminomethyltransferase T
MAEHRHCRAQAALFDVSHMGQVKLVGDDAAAALEHLVPVDVLDLAVGRQRYAFFTNDSGGILDDLMIVRPQPGSDFGDLLLVVNAGCKAADIATCRRTSATAAPWCRCPNGRCWPCRGRPPSRRWRGWRPAWPSWAS